MRYKVGDKVRIKSIDWYNENKDEVGNIRYKRDGSAYPVFFSKYMSNFCGEILTIKSVFKHSYHMNETSSCEFWTDEMIEGLVEEEIKPEPKFKVGDKVKLKSTLLNDIFGVIGYEPEGYRITNISNGLTYFMSYSIEHYYKLVEEEAKPKYEDEVTGEYYSTPKYLVRPNGYRFVDENGNVINETKIVLEKKPDDKLKLESTKKVREYWSEYARIYIEIYDNEPNECVLTHLYTLEGHRQKGYGRQALIEAESIAKELGCHTAYLKVETNSWMHEWYLRMGYKWYKTADKEYTWLVKNLTSIEEKKKEYPKTYEECCYITGFENTEMVFEDDYRDINPPKEQWKRLGLMNQLNKLLICRDAYWKIAGEEMGLDKPWEPDWNNISDKYCIYFVSGDAWLEKCQTRQCPFAFPTAEMRDAFYENFKELIEQCKELL